MVTTEEGLQQKALTILSSYCADRRCLLSFLGLESSSSEDVQLPTVQRLQTLVAKTFYE